MPFYTINIIRKMKKIDFVKSSYKDVMEHFYSTKNKPKLAEKISFISSPFLFISSILILLEIFADIDLFTLDFQVPMLLFISLSFIGSNLFNIWAFKTRDKHSQSVKQLLEEVD